MTMVAAAAGALILGIAMAAMGQTPVNKDLRVYFIDVEGGQATLFVTPAGESMLVDTGWPGANGRDADRIAAAAKDAGVTKIDDVVLTHYHVDHAGGIPQLAAKIPIGRFIDHGPNREDASVDGGAPTVASWEAYQKVLANGKFEHLVVKPGDMLPVRGMKVEVVSADGKVIDKPLPEGGEQNAACAKSPVKELEGNENDRSVGMVITFGRTRILDLGDLTWANERPLMCPVDKIGKVDVYVVSHHGFVRSGSPALLDAVAPRVAIMDNGGHKGGEPPTFPIIQGSPRFKDLWQLHTVEGPDKKNVADDHIANLASARPDAGNYLLLTVHPNGTMAVMNQRTGQTVEYPK
jgi:beta-lactamase superfamily II metal-dependent hydrolase